MVDMRSRLPELPLLSWEKAAVAAAPAFLQSLGYLSRGWAFWVGALIMAWIVWLLVISILTLFWRGGRRAYRVVASRLS